MKASSAVQAFRSLTSRLHPQLPLSERESQRLLKALTSSFRTKLDQQNTPDNTLASAQHTFPSGSATDTHLASILTNPLLTKSLHAQLKDKDKHPIALFEDYAASGRANLGSARQCLDAFRSSLDALSPADSAKQIQHYAAGTRALRWLWSTGSVSSLSFVLDNHLCNNLAYFLIQEGRESALYELLETHVPTSPQLSAKEVNRRKGLLLRCTVNSYLASTQHGLTCAIHSFFRTLELPSSSHVSFIQAGGLLNQRLIAGGLANPSDVSLYDRFVELVPRWNKNHPDRAAQRMANLKLHHPSNPSADDALTFIRQLKPLESHPFLTPTNSAQENHVFAFFFNTVKVLQNDGRFDDALWVMEFMQHKFPNEFAHPNSIAAKTASSASKLAENANNPSLESILPDWRAPEMG